jgi:hypothetical protein
MELTDWQIDLRGAGYDGDFNYESLKKAIESSGWRLESLVRMPEKRDLDWPKWCGRATKGNKSFSSRGETDLEALGKLALQANSVQ